MRPAPSHPPTHPSAHHCVTLLRALGLCTRPLLSSPEVQKVGFALDEDMRLLKRMTGGDGNSANRHRNVMDLHVKRQQLFPSARASTPCWAASLARTSHAQAWCSTVRLPADSGGLAGLCHAVLGKTMDKHWTMSDWLRRPLLPEQRLCVYCWSSACCGQRLVHERSALTTARAAWHQVRCIGRVGPSRSRARGEEGAYPASEALTRVMKRSESVRGQRPSAVATVDVAMRNIQLKFKLITVTAR